MSSPSTPSKVHQLMNEYRNTRDVLRKKRSGYITSMKDLFYREPRVQKLLSLQQEVYMYAIALWYIIITSIVIASCPHLWKYLYLLTLLILIPIRYVSYSLDNCVSFCFDFCYWGNFVTLYALFTDSLLALQIAQGMSFITLVATIMWQNKLQLHSLDKVTSCAIHFLPSLSMYVYNFLIFPYYPTERKLEIIGRALDSTTTTPTTDNIWLHETFSLTTHVAYPIAYYLLWQFFYALLVDLINGDLFEKDKTRQSSVHYFADNVNNFPIAILAQNCARKVKLFEPTEVLNGYKWSTKAVFYTFQLLFTMATIPIAWLQYYSQAVALLALCFCLNEIILEGSYFYLSTTFLKERVASILDSDRQQQEELTTKGFTHTASAPQYVSSSPTLPVPPDSPKQSNNESTNNNSNTTPKLSKAQKNNMRQRRHLKEIHDQLHHLFDQNDEEHDMHHQKTE